MKIGEVFIWRDFPYAKFPGEQKDRWFVYIGETSTLQLPIIATIITATTQTQHYERGAMRANHSHIHIQQGQYGFERDCVLDLDEGYYEYEASMLGSNPKIETRGATTEECLRRIYKAVLTSNTMSKQTQRDIYACLNRIGITGLKRP
jgi:hypothetical protein